MEEEEEEEEEFTDLGWFEGIICREMNSEEKYSPLVRTVSLQQEDTHTHTHINTMAAALMTMRFTEQRFLWSLITDVSDEMMN